MSSKLRQLLIGLSLFLMLMPLGLLGGMAAMGRMRMGSRMPDSPRFVAGQEEFRGPSYCRSCHQRQYEEWSTSLMANAIREEKFGHRSRQLAWMMPPEKCLVCHAPLSNSGVAKEEAISCEVCHGPGRTEAVVKNFCVVCHQDPMDFILTTGSEYGTSPAASQAKTCENCHMRAADGTPSHHFAGSRARPASYKGVLTLENIAVDDTGIVVTVHNTVEGHSLPTGAEVNVIYLEVTAYDSAGRVVFQKDSSFEKSVFFMGTMPMQVTADTRLKAGETRQVRFETTLQPHEVKATIFIKPVGLDGKPREFIVAQEETIAPGRITVR